VSVLLISRFVYVVEFLPICRDWILYFMDVIMS